MKKGQALIKLNSEILEAQYMVAKARAESQGRIKAAQAERDQQSHRYSLLSQLGKSSNSAERKREYAILQAAEGNLLTAKEEARIAQLEALRIRAEINQRILKTPIEGYVVSINKDVAEPVGVGKSDPNKPDYLVRVVKVSTLKATAFLPYKAVRHINAGDELIVAGTGLENPWRTTGKVEFVSPIIQAATGTVEVRVTIDNSDLTHKVGVPARIIVKVPLDPPKDENAN